MVLRIEDTDESLNKPEFIEAILEPLKTLGIDWDEGPHFQSQRRELHVDAVQKLVDDGHAYYCNLTRDQADKKAAEAGLPAGYHGWSREAGLEDGEGCVVRFRTPDEGEVVINDVIRGEVRFRCAELEDFVIRRSDKSPTFLVANAVDDADMGITHVVRGEDLLNTTPKVMLLWEALGLGDKPTYAHLPLLVNEQRKKLSKRRDDVSLGEFIEKGYLPEAIVNHLALLGWGPPDDVEIRPIAEIIELFDLANVNKGSAFFDIAKLDHINGEYIRAMPTETYIEMTQPYLTGADADVTWADEQFRPERFALVASEVQQRVTMLADAPKFVDWLFVDAVSYDVESKGWKKSMIKGKMVPEILEGIEAAFADVEWTAEGLNSAVSEVGDRLEARSQVVARIAITGTNAGVPMWDATAQLDREVVVRRVRAARALLS